MFHIYFLTLVHGEELTSWTAACLFPQNNVNIIRKDFLFSVCTGFRFTVLLWSCTSWLTLCIFLPLFIFALKILGLSAPWLCPIYTTVWSSVLSNMERCQGQPLLYFHMLYGTNTMITEVNSLEF